MQKEGTSTRMKNWNIRMPEHLVEAIAKTAAERGTDSSKFVRGLISEATQKSA